MGTSAMGSEVEQLAARTVELCAIPSVIGHEAAIANHLQKWAAGPFVPGERLRHGHSLVLGDLTDPRPSIALVGHLDTVPGSGSLAVGRENDRIIGLGSSDMKGGLAVMMRLAETLPRATLPYNVLFVFYEREEGPYAEN